MKHRPIEHYQYETSNLIIGSAEVAYCHQHKCWFAIGGTPIFTLEDATSYAHKLDSLIAYNTVRLASSK